MNTDDHIYNNDDRTRRPTVEETLRARELADYAKAEAKRLDDQRKLNSAKNAPTTALRLKEEILIALLPEFPTPPVKHSLYEQVELTRSRGRRDVWDSSGGFMPALKVIG